MEKVQQAKRGLQSCLRLRFLAKLPQAIPPKQSLEQQQQHQPEAASFTRGGGGGGEAGFCGVLLVFRNIHASHSKLILPLNK